MSFHIGIEEFSSLKPDKLLPFERSPIVNNHKFIEEIVNFNENARIPKGFFVNFSKNMNFIKRESKIKLENCSNARLSFFINELCFNLKPEVNVFKDEKFFLKNSIEIFNEKTSEQDSLLYQMKRGIYQCKIENIKDIYEDTIISPYSSFLKEAKALILLKGDIDEHCDKRYYRENSSLVKIPVDKIKERVTESCLKTSLIKDDYFSIIDLLDKRLSSPHHIIMGVDESNNLSLHNLNEYNDISARPNKIDYIIIHKDIINKIHKNIINVVDCVKAIRFYSIPLDNFFHISSPVSYDEKFDDKPIESMLRPLKYNITSLATSKNIFDAMRIDINK